MQQVKEAILQDLDDSFGHMQEALERRRPRGSRRPGRGTRLG
jgi:hypothetical protein